MTRRALFASTVSLMMLALMIGCSQQKQEKQETPAQEVPKTATPPTMGQGSPSEGTAAAAGVEWTVPAGWTVQPPRQMRVATYAIPAAEGESEIGECGVFFFGSGEGGDKQANIDRWAGQFEGNPKAEQSSMKVGEINVTIVRIAGTYLAPSGPMMKSQGKRENQKLLGAIVDAPGGSVFFKSVGSAKTITAAEASFRDMLQSIKSAAAH